MTDRLIYSIFKKGSRTYFYNSLFFPPDIKDDVFILYSFVRKADNYVDQIPPKPKKFYKFSKQILNAIDGKHTGDVVADSFGELARRKEFDPEWHEAFLRSMEMDLTKKSYQDLLELEEYIYGSAEVIGLYMSQIMGLPKKSHHCARQLGKAMQLINFIRDIDEDHSDLGRTYIPQDILKEYGFKTLDHLEVQQRPEAFKEMVRSQIEVYREWQKTAEKGYKYISKKHLVPVMNAAEMYKWTANRIDKDPFIVYRKKVKPSVPRIICNMSLRSLSASN